MASGKSPHGWLVARWPAHYAVALAQALELSRRITVERLGETKDYYIEGASIALRGFVRMEYLLSPVPGVGVPSAPVVTAALIRGKPTELAVSWSAPTTAARQSRAMTCGTRKPRPVYGLTGRTQGRAGQAPSRGWSRAAYPTTCRCGL